MKILIFSSLMLSCSSSYAHSGSPYHLDDINLATGALALLMLAILIATACSSKIYKAVPIKEQERPTVRDKRFDPEAKARRNV